MTGLNVRCGAAKPAILRTLSRSPSSATLLASWTVMVFVLEPARGEDCWIYRVSNLEKVAGGWGSEFGVRV
jgi:hypothetical protein